MGVVKGLNINLIDYFTCYLPIFLKKLHIHLRIIIHVAFLSTDLFHSYNDIKSVLS